MGTRYETDVVAWANEQAALLRSGDLSQLDIANIAEEIEDVGKSEKRELASRIAFLLTHLLKWQCQSGRRSSSWQRVIRELRKSIQLRVRKTPSLKSCLTESEWIEEVWPDAVAAAAEETGLDDFPDECIWNSEQILSAEFYPD
ncbi:DUF29 domain-containing protein [Serratia sp. CY56810]|uniref:DUF29 domain-containing protein n=1 Tax=Serratia sp. CY56810 TaxID=3383642 RepID=UPI003F9F51E1